MVEFDDSKQKLAALRGVIEEVADALDLPALEARKKELEKFVFVKFQAEDLADPRVKRLLARWELPGLPSFVMLEAKP